jgi:hypothetical protein
MLVPMTAATSLYVMVASVLQGDGRCMRQDGKAAGKERWIIFLGVLPYLAQVSVEKNS